MVGSSIRGPSGAPVARCGPVRAGRCHSGDLRTTISAITDELGHFRAGGTIWRRSTVGWRGNRCVSVGPGRARWYKASPASIRHDVGNAGEKLPFGVTRPVDGAEISRTRDKSPICHDRPSRTCGWNSERQYKADPPLVLWLVFERGRFANTGLACPIWSRWLRRPSAVRRGGVWRVRLIDVAVASAMPGPYNRGRFEPDAGSVTLCARGQKGERGGALRRVASCRGARGAPRRATRLSGGRHERDGGMSPRRLMRRESGSRRPR